jgi:hypothetical protein
VSVSRISGFLPLVIIVRECLDNFVFLEFRPAREISGDTLHASARPRATACPTPDTHRNDNCEKRGRTGNRVTLCRTTTVILCKWTRVLQSPAVGIAQSAGLPGLRPASCCQQQVITVVERRQLYYDHSIRFNTISTTAALLGVGLSP